MSKQLEAIEFYSFVLKTFNDSNIPYLVGGTHAFGPYTGITRDTKDLDLFIYKEDCERSLKLFSDLGFKTELHFSHWIGKIYSGNYLTDLIFNSGNGLCPVDKQWFENAVPGEVLGIPVYFCPPEEIIWQKGFIMEHLRYDGADIAHIIYARAEQLDWIRLVDRFGPHWRVLLSHLILFGFIYPDEQHKIPDAVMYLLLTNLRNEMESESPKDKLCQGTFLSILEYLSDLREKSYEDARMQPFGNLTKQQVIEFTQAFLK